MPTLKTRQWVFTVNNPTPLEVEVLKATNNLCKYMIVGHEVGENGTPHLQGYVTMKNAYRFTSIKQLMDDRAHVEPAKGNIEQNFKYCSKDGEF